MIFQKILLSYLVFSLYFSLTLFLKSWYYEILQENGHTIQSFYVEAVWMKFDLVRPRKDAWGSNESTPFYRIDRPYNEKKNLSETEEAFNLGNGAQFGYSVCNLGDVDNNGYDDLAVGAIGENIGNKTNTGGVYILLMEANGTYSNYTHINGVENALEPILHEGDQFGYSLACIGDLNDDGIVELAVGAPGVVISSVYVLSIYWTGEVIGYHLIRGKYDGQTPTNFTSNSTISTNSTVFYNDTYIPNGPPIVYGSRFGSALAVIDININYYYELAVSSLSSSGENIVYLLFMNETGWVQNYVIFSPSQAGLHEAFTNFGSSMTLLPKIKRTDEFYTFAIGASKLYETGSINTDAGSVFLFYITSTGYVNHTRLISETTAEQTYAGLVLPFVPFEAFGTALTTNGDINRDNYGQKHPTKLNWKGTPSIPDLIVGCPQSKSSGGTGRIFIVYLDEKGIMNGYTSLPAKTDLVTNISLQAYEQFGAAVAGYQDLDKNGLKEIIVGAPSRVNLDGINAGAIYILFTRRRRYHPKPFDYVRFYLIIFLPTGLFCGMFIFGIIYFCWYFRRIPDEVEIIVKKSGLKVNPEQPRQKYVRQNVVYIEEYA